MTLVAAVLAHNVGGMDRVGDNLVRQGYGDGNHLGARDSVWGRRVDEGE